MNYLPVTPFWNPSLVAIKRDLQAFSLTNILIDDVTMSMT